MAVRQNNSKEKSGFFSYEFQARDKFWRFVRGRVNADSEAEAKELVKARGLWWPLVWLAGTKPWVAYGKVAPGGDYHMASLKLLHQDESILLYGTRKVLTLGFGFLLLLIGVGLFAYCGHSLLYVWSPLKLPTVLFILLVGIIFLAVGLGLILLRFEVRVDRKTRQIVIRMCIFPFVRRSNTINATAAKEIIVRKEIFFVGGGEICYVVAIVIANQDIQLDFSSSKKKELEIGQKIAEYLGVPFIDEVAE